MSEEKEAQKVEASVIRETGADYNTAELLREIEEEMIIAADRLEFERAALLRDQVAELKKKMSGETPSPHNSTLDARKRPVIYARRRAKK